MLPLSQLTPLDKMDLHPDIVGQFNLTHLVMLASNVEQKYVESKLPEILPDANMEAVGWPALTIGIGSFCEAPLTVTVRWRRIDDLVIAYYYPVSRVVNWQGIEVWFERNCCPTYRQSSDGRLYRSFWRATNYREMAQVLHDPATTFFTAGETRDEISETGERWVDQNRHRFRRPAHQS